MRTMWRAAVIMAALGCMLTVTVPRAEAASQSFSKDQLSQLVAPVALYPDSLLMQVLMASAYPTEVVDADRWLKAHSTLTLQQQQQQLGSQTWDPSVISLVAFPSVLSRMASNLDWTEALGEAFLAQKNDLLNAVQQMRAMASQAGNLQSSQQMTVANSGGYYTLAPPADNSVYVPLYDPSTVYGTSWSAGSWFWPGAMAAPIGWTAGVGFGAGVAVGSAMFGTVNWGTRAVAVNGNYWNYPAYRTAAGNSIYARNGSVNVNSSQSFTHNGNTTTVNRNTTASGYGNSANVNRNTSVTHNGNTVGSVNRNATATGYGNSASVNRNTSWQYDNAHRQGANFQNPTLQHNYSSTTTATRGYGYGSASVTRTAMPGSTSIPYSAPAAAVTGTRSTGFGTYSSASAEARASARGAYSTGSAGAGFNRSYNASATRSVNFGGGGYGGYRGRR